MTLIEHSHLGLLKERPPWRPGKVHESHGALLQPTDMTAKIAKKKHRVIQNTYAYLDVICFCFFLGGNYDKNLCT
jgi:hypothetical protein